MVKRAAALSITSGLALLATACSNEPEEVAVVEDTPLTEPALVLTPEQEGAFAEMDRSAFDTEYRQIRDAIRVEAEEGAQASGAEGVATGSDSAAATSGGVPAPAEMDFAWLDRNDDGQLSVAEYAIWKVPVDPLEPKPNDATKPYLTDDQINEAGRSFFYYDQDGSTYLSEAEFAAAKTGTSSGAA